MSNIKEKIIKAYNEAYPSERPVTELSDKELGFILMDSDEIYSRKVSGSRWWDNIEKVVSIGNKYFSYIGATTTGDMSPLEAGWEFDVCSAKEVEPYTETIVVTKYRTIG